MDFDLEIISEEGESPDPLFSSIISAMNSMKEATADKIYQKIQKEGETNYSKPQVDRALANALKYGIFEVKNNRYRVRDDFLDDEDTVYWQLQRKREQTPFRIREDINDRQFGPKLDPEKDNLRFRKMTSKDRSECPQCGRIKRPLEEDGKASKRGRKPRSTRPAKKRRKQSNKRNARTKKTQRRNDKSGRGTMYKRKTRQDTINEEKSKNSKTSQVSHSSQEKNLKASHFPEGAGRSPNFSIESDLDLPSSASDDDQSFTSYNDDTAKYHNKKSYEYLPDADTQDDGIMSAKRSSTSFKSESDSDQSKETSASDNASQTGYQDEFFESLPCTSRNAQLASHSSDTSCQNQLSSEMYRSQGDRSQEKSNWMECSDEPQGAIIESHNVLTIEPMDMLVFKSPEHASYIS